jgi:hypothetical protein
MVHWLYTRVIRPSIFHGALVWWPKVMQTTTKIQLGRTQRMACLAITGAMKSTPTAAMEVLLDLTPLDLLIIVEARMAHYRLHILKQPAVPKTIAVLLSGKMWVTYFGYAVGLHYSSLSLLQNLQSHYRLGLLEKQRPSVPWGCSDLAY